MTVVLQTNNSENNKIKKSVSTIATKTGSLRESTSIVNPKILVQGDLTSLKNCNYMTISDFGRSYFVTDIVAVGKGVVELTGHCDVLSSFSSQILSNRAVVLRQENSFNRYLNDSKFMTYQNNNIKTAVLSGEGFTQAGFILVTAGQNPTLTT